MSLLEVLNEALAARARIEQEIAELAGRAASRAMTDGERQRLSRLQVGLARAEEAERKAVLDAADAGELEITRGDNPPRPQQDFDSDPFGEPRSIRRDPVWEADIHPRTPVSEIRSRALSAVERMSGASAQVREGATRLLERFDDSSGSLSRLALAASSPDYLRAFVELARSGGQSAVLSEREVQAVRRVRSEARAMSLIDTSGGYLVPFQLDPTVIISSTGSTNPIRNIARKVVATGDTWNGVSSAAVSWSWDAEAAEVSDDATTFSQPSIPVYKAAGFVPISIEALQDEQNVAGEVGRLLAFGKDTLESAAFTTGSGSGQPTGIVTALSGGSSEVAATTNNAFGLPDVYLLDEALPARHRAGASWLAHRTILNGIRKFETTAGALAFPSAHSENPSLLGRPLYEASDMDGALGTGDDRALIVGDFTNYVVADRVGTMVEFIPHLFSTSNNRPTGQRGWYAFYRVGADSVLDDGFRMLKV